MMYVTPLVASNFWGACELKGIIVQQLSRKLQDNLVTKTVGRPRSQRPLRHLTPTFSARWLRFPLGPLVWSMFHYTR